MPRATRSITHYLIGFVFTPGSLFVVEDVDRFNRGEIACSESFRVYRRKATSRRPCIRVVRKWTTSLFHLHGARTNNAGWKSKCEVVRGNTPELARGRKLDTTERRACREYRGFVDFLSREGLTNRSAAVSSQRPAFFVSLTGFPALFFFSASHPFAQPNFDFLAVTSFLNLPLPLVGHGRFSCTILFLRSPFSPTRLSFRRNVVLPRLRQ